MRVVWVERVSRPATARLHSPGLSSTYQSGWLPCLRSWGDGIFNAQINPSPLFTDANSCKEHGPGIVGRTDPSTRVRNFPLYRRDRAGRCKFYQTHTLMPPRVYLVPAPTPIQIAPLLLLMPPPTHPHPLPPPFTPPMSPPLLLPRSLCVVRHLLTSSDNAAGRLVPNISHSTSMGGWDPGRRAQSPQVLPSPPMMTAQHNC